jgi:hypothetical protein
MRLLGAYVAAGDGDALSVVVEAMLASEDDEK